MALAAAALVAALGLIAPSGAGACDWERRPARYGYGYPTTGPTFSFSFGTPAPVVVYRDRIVRSRGYAWGPPPKWRNRYYADDRPYGYGRGYR